MVHELHKAGYQRLRIAPFIHEVGTWRCPVTFIQNLRTDVCNAQMIIDYDQAPQYTSASGAEEPNSYFGWSNTHNRTARELASMFITNYPRIADLGKGQDWDYAGWFTTLLGTVESTGKVPIIISDGNTYEKCFLPPRAPTGIYGKLLDKI